MKRIFLMLLPVVILSACQSGAVSGETVTTQDASYKNITPYELRAMLENRDFVFVNVHIPFAGDIAGTDVSIAYDEILQVAKNSKVNLDIYGEYELATTESFIS